MQCAPGLQECMTKHNNEPSSMNAHLQMQFSMCTNCARTYCILCPTTLGKYAGHCTQDLFFMAYHNALRGKRLSLTEPWSNMHLIMVVPFGTTTSHRGTLKRAN